MSPVTKFEEEVLKDQLFQLPEKELFSNLCALAKPYYEWCVALLSDIQANSTEISVNLALLQLQRQYWNRYEAAPAQHRNHIGMRSKHTCLFQVYHHYYLQLRELHFDVNPPQLREAPPPPYMPAPPQIAGVPFGILEDDAGD